jgi:hypothetical protein
MDRSALVSNYDHGRKVSFGWCASTAGPAKQASVGKAAYYLAGEPTAASGSDCDFVVPFA